MHRYIKLLGDLVNALCILLVQIWNVSNGELLHLCAPVLIEEGAATHGGWVTDLCFSPDSKMLVSAGGYLKVSLSLKTMKEKNSLYTTFQAIFHFLFLNWASYSPAEWKGSDHYPHLTKMRQICKTAFFSVLGSFDDSVRDVFCTQLSQCPILR